MSVVSGIVGAISGRKAASAQSSAARNAAQMQQQQFEQTREDMQPWMGAGGNALAALQFELGLGERPTFGGGERPEIQTVTGAPTANPDSGQRIRFWMNEGSAPPSQPGRTTFNVGDQRFNTMREAEAFAGQQATPGMEYGGFRETPGYAFRVGEGQKAIERSAAARGGLNSGATMKALQSFGQNIAADEYGNYLNRLSALAGTGQTSVGALGQFGASSAANQGNALMAAGNARASGYQAVGSGFQNALQGIGQIAGMWTGGSTPFRPVGAAPGGLY